MKAAGNQRSILSFFGPPKASQGISISNSSNKKDENLKGDESPIKKSKRKSRVIQSDSEEEEEEKLQPEQSCENKENKENDAVIEEKEVDAAKEEESSPSTSAGKNVGFSAETVPPLRKTARKQMKRKSDALEDQQLEVIKKLKSSSSPKTSSSSPKTSSSSPKTSSSSPKTSSSSPKASSSSPKASSDSKSSRTESKSGTPKGNDKKNNKRTNCLDRFVFKKADRNADTELESKEDGRSKPEVSSASSPDKKKEEKCNPEKEDSKDEEMEVDESSDTDSNSPQKKTSPVKDSKQQKGSPEKKTSPQKMESPVKQMSPKKESPQRKKDSPQSIKSTEKSKSSPKTSCGKPSPSSGEKSSESKVVKNPFSFSKQNQSESKSYDPSKAKYDPLEDASWKRNEDVPFAALSKTFELIEDTSGRLKIVEILSNFLRSVIVLSPKDLLHCIYLCLNKMAPSFEGIELGVGEIYVCRAVAQVTGRSVSMIKNELAEEGDLGLVAEHSKSNQRMMFLPAPLTVSKVFKNLKEIALMSGQASQNKKIEKIKSMFVACKGSEARFLIRFCGGKLRIGLAEQSVLQAIGQACFLTPPGQEFPPEILNAGKGLSAENLKAKVDEFSSILKTTYCECPTFDSIVPILLDKGMKELPNYCKLEPGIPLKPMLAHPTKGVSEVLKRFEKSKFTCEYKYDGERAQIHLKEDGTVSIFSRNQENNTTKYPDIISRLKDSLGPDVKSCVLDSEAVAFDVNEKKILPFQILSTRKRKDANESEIKVQVCVFPFDLLYLNGRNLVTEPFEVRRGLLQANFVEKEGQFTFAKSIDSTNTEDIEEFLEESVKGNCEGLMVKSLDVDATYEIAKRSRNWLKLKKDYLEGVGDTIDVVAIGGFLGKGKRTGAYGGFLLACYDPDNEEFQSLCKIGTGFTEDSLQQHTTFFKDHLIENPKSYYRYDSSVTPDHWFDAVQVWEIKCADLSISPVHKAALGIVDPEKGISLRFPRFLRIRDDKSPENATSASQIADLYRNQDQIKNQTDSNNCEEDFY